MRTTSNSRLTLAALIATIGLGAATAPAVSVAQPIGGSAPAKNCKLNGGNTIRSGSRGRAGGIEYACNDGIACQVEGGRTTGRCSHAAARVNVGTVRQPGVFTAAR